MAFANLYTVKFNEWKQNALEAFLFRFPDRPQMTDLRRVPGEFPLPKIRESFTHQFADLDEEDILDENTGA